MAVVALVLIWVLDSSRLTLWREGLQAVQHWLAWMRQSPSQPQTPARVGLETVFVPPLLQGFYDGKAMGEPCIALQQVWGQWLTTGEQATQLWKLWRLRITILVLSLEGVACLLSASWNDILLAPEQWCAGGLMLVTSWGLWRSCQNDWWTSQEAIAWCARLFGSDGGIATEWCATWRHFMQQEATVGVSYKNERRELLLSVAERHRIQWASQCQRLLECLPIFELGVGLVVAAILLVSPLSSWFTVS